MKTRTPPLSFVYEREQDITGRWRVILKVVDGDQRATRDTIVDGFTERESGRFVILAEKGGLAAKVVR